MKEETMAEIIRENENKADKTNVFKLTYADGRTEKKRMFVTSEGYACEFKKRSRKLGWRFSDFNNLDSVVKFEPVKKKTRICCEDECNKNSPHSVISM